jgi:cardiolipin synthase A/B
MDNPDPQSSYTLLSTILLLADLVIRIGLSFRVIMRKRPYGVSLAWLVVILLIPFLGGFFYLLFGENRIPERRIERARASYRHYQHWLKTLRQRAPVSWQRLNPECAPLHRQAETLVGLPAMAGNNLTLITHPEEILSSIIAGIEGARSTCHLQFYIWQDGGRVDRVIEALIAAAARGVVCRLLLDAIGSRDFLKSPTAAKMKAAGIKVQESLPAGLIKALFSRIDIRNHRKLVVIDGKIAFTGSQNMVDPNYFKKDAGVGDWIDLMVRVEGPVVESLAGTFISDWFLDADVGQYRSQSLLQDIETVRQIGDIHPLGVAGAAAVQLVPSGPGFAPETIHSLLLTTIYAARRQLIMTTPYFIPDEPLLLALKAAAQRGVRVTLVVPQKNDSRLVHYASQARFEELAEAGVTIALFHGGLLHAKTITVDRNFSLFGSVNLDMRSFWLNLEATLFIYCESFTEKLYSVQQEYISQSSQLDMTTFRHRGNLMKFKENTCLLVSPLL